MAGSAFAWDATLKKYKGPVELITRWSSETNWYDRLSEAAYGPMFLLELLGEFKLPIPLEYTFIAIEEPWAYGHAKNQHQSGWLKQQAQIQGALLSSLLRYGYREVNEINNQSWRGIVADYLGITTHYSKWGKGSVGKVRARQWAEAKWPKLEKYPDLISSSKHGLIPRPEGSRAQAAQCDDRYAARAMAWWMRREVLAQLTVE
jgi:hypothetical protein